MEAECHPVLGDVSAARGDVRLELDLGSAPALQRSVTRWEEELETGCTPARAKLLRHWIRWAHRDALSYVAWTGPVSLLRWADVQVTALPGEPFAAAASSIRSAIGAEEVTFVLGYSGGCPGYLPACEEYESGGYEVTEAHRFYGLPGAFSQGALEHLVQRVIALSTADHPGVTP